MVLNTICNLIPHETAIFDDRDTPWITSCIKNQLTIKIARLNASKNISQKLPKSYLILIPVQKRAGLF